MSRPSLRPWLWCALAFVLLASARGQTVPSAGAKSGWVYYGLLAPPSGGSPTEQWIDVNTTLVGAAPGSKKPSSGMQLRSDQVVTIRQATPGAGTGAAALAPIIGVVAPGSTMNITEVVEHPVARGVQYWLKIQS